MMILAFTDTHLYPPFIVPRWALFLVATLLFVCHVFRIRILYKEIKISALTSMLKLVSVYFFLGYLILYTGIHAISEERFSPFTEGAYFFWVLFSWHYSYPLFFTLIYASISQAYMVWSISKLEQKIEQSHPANPRFDLKT
jgi:hypothetical protein